MSDEIVEVTVSELQNMICSNSEQKAIDLSSFDNSKFDMGLFVNSILGTFNDIVHFGISAKNND